MRLFHLKISALILLLSCFPIFSQKNKEKLATNYSCLSKDINSVIEFFDNSEVLQKRVAESEMKLQEEQIAKYGRILPKISGYCEWGVSGCPVRLAKPFYSEEARSLRISGQIIVETIVDENGKVIFAQAKKWKVFSVASCRNCGLSITFHIAIS